MTWSAFTAQWRSVAEAHHLYHGLCPRPVQATDLVYCDRTGHVFGPYTKSDDLIWTEIVLTWLDLGERYADDCADDAAWQRAKALADELGGYERDGVEADSNETLGLRLEVFQ